MPGVILLCLVVLGLPFWYYLLQIIKPFLRYDDSKIWNVIWLLPLLINYGSMLHTAEFSAAVQPGYLVSRIVMMTGSIVVSLVLIRALQEAQAAKIHQIKAEFLTGLSHDLKTPVTVMELGLARLSGTVCDPEARKQLGLVRENSRRLQQLIQNLLEVGRLDSGPAALRPELLPLDKLLPEAQERYEDYLEELGISLEVGYPSNAVIAADPARIWSILDNLVYNAARFTAPGGRIRLLAEREAEHTLLRVSDTGSGIAPEHLPHVFERLYSADARGRGTGMGLYIVRTLTESMGGAVSVESTPGKGTRFTLRFRAELGRPPSSG